MGTRREARESILQILYKLEISANNQLSILEEHQVLDTVDNYFANFDSSIELRTFVASHVKGVASNIDEIDTQIAKHSPKWRLERMARVDRNVLRLSTYELLFSLDLPTGIIIDEAIEIARKFGSEQSASFVNGVLDSIAKDVRGKKPGQRGDS